MILTVSPTFLDKEEEREKEEEEEREKEDWDEDEDEKEDAGKPLFDKDCLTNLFSFSNHDLCLGFCHC